ncbi:MAG: ABC transporter permease [Planctomycetota bacterium]
MMLKRSLALSPLHAWQNFSLRRGTVKTIACKAYAFILRDYRNETSYKLNFFLKGLSSIVPLFFFFFISKLIPMEGTQSLSKYGGSYLAFVTIGVAFHRYLQLSLRMYADSIRNAQVTGSLESMLGSQTRPVALVLMSSIYGLMSATVHLALILGVAVSCFGLDFSAANIPASLLIFCLSILTFVSFGIIAATTIILFKRGDPVTWLFSNLGVVLGGAYFPMEVMPTWLQKIAWVNPITHSLEALRLTLLQGKSLLSVWEPVVILGGMSALLFPASLWLFSWAIDKGKKDGTLMQY